MVQQEHIHKQIDNDTVFKVIALAVSDLTPDHHLRYLLSKLYGHDGLSLDSNNTQIYNRLKAISEEINKGDSY